MCVVKQNELFVTGIDFAILSLCTFHLYFTALTTLKRTCIMLYNLYVKRCVNLDETHKRTPKYFYYCIDTSNWGHMEKRTTEKTP